MRSERVLVIYSGSSTERREKRVEEREESRREDKKASERHYRSCTGLG
jgi:hypothetical protein